VTRSGAWLATEIERDLRQTVEARLSHFFDREIAPGREPIVFGDVAELGLSFKIREARVDINGGPDAYVTLRERRLLQRPDRPEEYSYGLLERQADGAWRYEAFHGHMEGKSLSTHYQVELHNEPGVFERTLERQPTGAIHVVAAVERLLAAYYGRHADDD